MIICNENMGIHVMWGDPLLINILFPVRKISI